ncbi:hypothetical protein CEQ90_13125 [Lewinellaceae bacterium SD302]|nr:hypothetical protein CEQ90_13125 [Lewinellaceae bacterium SD302]
MRFGLSLLFCFLLPLSGYAQSGWNVRQFSTSDGLPDRTVNAVATDSFGFSWLALETGIVRFDGHRFDRPDFLEALKLDGENVIRKMVLDDHGRVICWTGGSDYLQYIDGGTNKVARLSLVARTESGRLREHQSFLLQPRQAIAELSRNGEEISVYELKDTSAQLVLRQTLSGHVQYLGRKRSGKPVLYSQKNNELQIGGQSEIRISTPATDRPPLILYLDAADRIWWQADDSSQLRVLLPGNEHFVNWQKLSRPENESRFNRIFEDEKGNLIFGVIKPTITDALVLLGPSDSLEDLRRFLRVENKIVALAGKDFQQSIELATHGGYYRFDRKKSRLSTDIFLYNSELVKNNFGYIIRGFAEGSDGRVYGNTEGALWFRLSADSAELDTLVIHDESGRSLRGLTGAGHNLIAQDDYIYGSYGDASTEIRKNYLTRYHVKRQTWERFEIPEPKSFVRFIQPLPDGDLMLFTFRREDRATMVFRFNPDDQDFLNWGTINEELPRRSRTAVQNVIYDSTRQKIWVAVGNGLFAYPYCARNQPCYFEAKNKTPERYREINFHVQSLVLENDGNILLGTLGEGVQSFNPESRRLRTIAFDPRSGNSPAGTIELPSNLIAEVLPLSGNYLAITTFNGLVVADLDTRQSITYTSEDGLPNDEFNRLAAFKSSQGMVYLGGINGFARIGENDLLPKPTGPSPQLSRYYFFDEDERQETVYFPAPREELRQIIVPPGQLRFGLDLLTPGARSAQYRTWLEGYELDYGPVKSSANAEYLRVPAGSYTLHAKAVTTEGEESATPLQLAIRVQAPWYLRPWFILLTQLLLIAFGVLLYRNRVKRIQAEEAENRRVAKQLAELELKILRQQLNPHFIFNALGAIQHFIQQQKGRAAMAYLADFAKLMRMFLESSKQSYIFLNDELELIKLYVRLERLRFKDSFDVVYDIDPDLDLEMEDIPSLLLQPFVENAINHGLFHLKRHGTLTIGMRQDEEERIICTISDDGIGRKAAAELRKKTYRKHKSRATQIVTERLNIFQRTGETDLQITTEDLYPEREETGTKVVIVVEGG